MLTNRESKNFIIIPKNNDIEGGEPYTVVKINDFRPTYSIYIKIKDEIFNTCISPDTHTCCYMIDDSGQYSSSGLTNLPSPSFIPKTKLNFGEVNEVKSETIMRGSGLQDAFEGSVPSDKAKIITSPNNKNKLFIDDNSITLECGSNRVTINDKGIQMEGQISKDSSAIKSGIFKENTIAQMLPTSFVTPGPPKLPFFPFNISDIIAVNKLIGGIMSSGEANV